MLKDVSPGSPADLQWRGGSCSGFCYAVFADLSHWMHLRGKVPLVFLETSDTWVQCVNALCINKHTCLQTMRKLWRYQIQSAWSDVVREWPTLKKKPTFFFCEAGRVCAVGVDADYCWVVNHPSLRRHSGPNVCNKTSAMSRQHSDTMQHGLSPSQTKGT